MSDDERNDTGRRPLIEWVFGILSGGAIAALLLFLGWEAVSGNSGPPDLVVRVIGSDSGTDSGSVHFELENLGDRAAAGVSVMAEAAGTQRVVEFDYVAPGSVRSGAIAFPAPLSEDELVLKVGGYVDP